MKRVKLSTLRNGTYFTLPVETCGCPADWYEIDKTIAAPIGRIGVINRYWTELELPDDTLVEVEV